MQYMKRVSNNFCILLLLILVLCLLPVGCGLFAVTEAPTPEPTEAPTPAPTPTPEPTFEHIAVRTPSPTPRETPIPTETPEPTPEPTAAGPTPFSIVWMSDTQNLTRHYPEVFNSMRDWILRERESQNIVFLIHTGDVVDACSPFMWSNASIALVPVLYEIPGMVVSGNHDVGSDNRQSLFNERPYAMMTRKEGQTYRDGDCAYQIFTAGGDEFLVFGFGYSVNSTAVWRWVNSVMDEHPDAVALFVMHYALQEDNRYSGQARELVRQVAANRPNAKLLLCGHFDGVLMHEEWIDDDGDGETDRCFYTMMFNLQDDLEEGMGYMRILTFYPEDRHIEVKTYSPWYDRWDYPKLPSEETDFILDNAF